VVKAGVAAGSFPPPVPPFDDFPDEEIIDTAFAAAGEC